MIAVPLQYSHGSDRAAADGALVRTPRQHAPNFREYADFASNPFARAIAIFLDFGFRLIVGAIFSPRWGLLGAIFFRKKSAPPLPPTTDLPPSI